MASVTMASRRERVGWVAVTVVILALAIPWFLWGDGRLWLGLPLWLWWHIAWLAMATGVLYLFVTRAWGAFVTRGEPA